MEKYIKVDGYEWRLTGDYYKRHITIFLHRYIWEKHFGTIPEGHHIHHKDGNKLNNDIENLECLKQSDHHKRTWKDNYEKMRSYTKENLKKAIEWRSTAEAKPLLSAKSKKAWLKRNYEICICEHCNKEFKTRMPKLAKWCSKKCCKAHHYQRSKDGMAS